MSTGRTTPEQAQRIGPGRRILLVGVGGAVALVGAALALLFVVLFVHAVREGRLSSRGLLEGGIATLAGTAIFGGLSAMGVDRMMRGVRGHPRARRAAAVRAEGWYRRNWYLAGLLAWAVLVLAGLATSKDPAAFLSSKDQPMGRVPWYALLAHVLLPVHVAVHETGHALAGALVGFRFTSLRVGWLTVIRAGARLDASWGRPSAPDLLGLHTGTPTSAEGLRGRLAVHALAGPAVTLATSGACAAGALAIGHPATVGQMVASHALWVGWWVGVALGLANLVPFRTRSGAASDGATVLRCLRPETPAMMAVQRFQALWAQGRRPREWDVGADYFLAVVDGEPSRRDTLYLAALAVALDVGNQELASAILGRALESQASGDMATRFELELQAAMIEAFQGNPAGARKRLDRLGEHPGMVEYPRLAEAVVAAAEGHLSDAAAGLESWERALEATGMAASIRMGNQWAVDALQAKLSAIAGSRSGASSVP